MLLQLGVGYSYRAARKLNAVKHQIVCVGKNLFRGGIKVLYALVKRFCERVVHSVPVAGFFVILKERELGYPKQVVFIGDNFKPLCNGKAQSAEN